jgi:hypothetical protein
MLARQPGAPPPCGCPHGGARRGRGPARTARSQQSLLARLPMRFSSTRQRASQYPSSPERIPRMSSSASVLLCVICPRAPRPSSALACARRARAPARRAGQDHEALRLLRVGLEVREALRQVVHLSVQPQYPPAQLLVLGLHLLRPLREGLCGAAAQEDLRRSAACGGPAGSSARCTAERSARRAQTGAVQRCERGRRASPPSRRTAPAWYALPLHRRFERKLGAGRDLVLRAQARELDEKFLSIHVFALSFAVCEELSFLPLGPLLVLALALWRHGGGAILGCRQLRNRGLRIDFPRPLLKVW